MEKNPCCIRTWPVPLQVGQVLGLVPGLAPEPPQNWHSTRVGMRILTSLPATASSKVRLRS